VSYTLSAAVMSFTPKHPAPTLRYLAGMGPPSKIVPEATCRPPVAWELFTVTGGSTYVSQSLWTERSWPPLR
jgi:hypothetical protein